MRNACLAAPVRQRGFAAVFGAIAMIAMLSAVALTIDIGRLYNAQRNLQKLADVAALDAVRIASGCVGGGSGMPANQSAAASESAASLLRNSGAAGDITALTEVGRRRFIAGANGDSEALQGFEVLPETSPLRDAVRVRLTRPMPSRLIPGITGSDGGQLMATAVAAQPARGELSIGSDVLSLNGGALNSVIGGLLCAAGDATCQAQVIALDVAGNSGLLSAGVTLQQLATALDLSVKDLANPVTLNTQTPVASDVLDGLAGSLGGSVNGSVTTLLGALADAARANPNGVPLASLLGPVTEVAGDVPFVNLLDLIVGLGQAAQAGSGQPIRLNLASLASIPNVTQIDAFVTVIEPPQFSGMGPAGQTRASTAQLRLQLRLSLNALQTTTNTLNGLLGVLGSSITMSPINLGIDVEVAKAEAFLDSLQCPQRDLNNGLPVAGLSARTAAADIRLGTFSGNGATAPPLAAGATPILTANITAAFGLASSTLQVVLNNPVTASAGGGVQILEDVTRFEPPPSNLLFYVADGAPLAPPSNDNPQRVGNSNALSGAFSSLFGSLNLSTSSSAGGSNLCVLLVACVPLSGLLDPLLAGVSAVLGPLLTGVGGIVDTLLDPLLNALGIQIGGATVTLHAVEIPQPRVVTTVFASAAP